MKLSKSGLIAGFIFAALLMFYSTGFSQKAGKNNIKDTIKDIQALIDQSGGRWVAGETSLSNLSWNEWLNYVGLDFEPVNAPGVSGLSDVVTPSFLDWRDFGGDYVTEIRNQAKCGSCWAFAMTGGLESYALLIEKKPGVDLDLSEQIMLSCSGVGSCSGGRLNARYLEKTGLPPEEYYPYTATNGKCSNATDGWQEKTYKIGDWGSVSRDLASLKAALVKYGPLPTAMMVYEDFMHYKSGIYSHVTGRRLGGHAILLIGYSDEEKYFIVKNSWGTKWGENGFFRIDYSQIKYPVYFGLSTIAYYDEDGNGAPASYEGHDSIGGTEPWLRAAPMFESLLKW